MPKKVEKFLPSTRETFILKMLSNPRLGLSEIVETYNSMFPSTEDLTLDEVQALQIKHVDKIKESRKEWIKDLEAVAVTHTRTRIELFQEIAEYCMTEQVVGTQKTGPDEWTPIYKKDPQGAIAALKAIREEIHGLKKLQLEAMRINNNPFGNYGGGDEPAKITVMPELPLEDGFED